MRLRLVPEKTNFDFFRFRKLTMGFSIVAVIASLLMWVLVGLNFGIDFRGGTTIRTEATQSIDVGEYRAAIDALDLGEVTIIEVFDPNFRDDQNVSLIRIQAQEGQESVTSNLESSVLEALGSKFGGTLSVSVKAAENNQISQEASQDALSAIGLSPTTVVAAEDSLILTYDQALPVGSTNLIKDTLTEAGSVASVSFSYETFMFTSVESVGPKVSGELVQTALLAIAAALGAILVYIWLRFEWQFSVGAVAALFHDVILTIGLFSLLQIRFDLSTIAAILTIVGYSINDTVVIFDRLRENLRKYKKMDLKEVMNLSVNETLSRTLMTSGTTLLALIALLIFGGDVIRGFVFAITWGVIVGTYSSVYVAKNVVLMLGVKRDWSKPTDGGGAGTQFANVDA